ncbi:hypothetical protein GUJ93_ZPchr0458g22417 [Zizania palustris]|uniref:Uncharacterized protein n=1 Tax=Zizania palustris TaxID=103762 RepID=A0A8J5R0X0_ZIZPA|nr:hypothetical protein GUJ93_ZPchr0458g22417 [Zizania palustris]
MFPRACLLARPPTGRLHQLRLHCCCSLPSPVCAHGRWPEGFEGRRLRRPHSTSAGASISVLSESKSVIAIFRGNGGI